MTHNMWLVFFAALTNKQKKMNNSAGSAGERQADSTSSRLYFLPRFDALKHQSVCRPLTFSTNIWLTFGRRARLNLSSARLKLGFASISASNPFPAPTPPRSLEVFLH